MICWGIRITEEGFIIVSFSDHTNQDTTKRRLCRGRGSRQPVTTSRRCSSWVTIMGRAAKLWLNSDGFAWGCCCAATDRRVPRDIRITCLSLSIDPVVRTVPLGAWHDGIRGPSWCFFRVESCTSWVGIVWGIIARPFAVQIKALSLIVSTTAIIERWQMLLVEWGIYVQA
jgi:hypothetical protein